MAYTISDFNDARTLRTLYKKVVPSLEKVARYEFGAICGGVDVNGADICEIRDKAEMLKKFLCSYVDGLAELHGTHSAEFYGDASAQRELHQEHNAKKLIVGN